MLLLLLTAVSVQAGKLTIVPTVGNHIDLISVYGHNELGSWNTFRSHTEYNKESKGYDYDVAAGDSVMIDVPFTNKGTGWKYTYMECEGKKIHENSDSYQALIFIMPDHDVTIYIYAEYDPDAPDLPGNPSPGGWNAATGELIVSGFQSGTHDGEYHENEMSGVVYSILERCGVNQSDVKKVTVIGEIGDAGTLSWLDNYGQTYYDLQFPNVETVDLRHTYGLQAYNYDYAFANTLTLPFSRIPLKKLILPSSIEQLWQVYWGLYTELKEVTLYAPVPPTVPNDITTREHFDKLPAGCTLYVPEHSVAAYKADALWNKFASILPIPDGEAEDITVDLPDNFTDGRYQGMSLQLFNARTGEQTKYLVDERPSYIFYAQTNDEPYTAHLVSSQGVLIASTDTLTLGNQPMEMTFKSVQPMHTVELTVQTPSEETGGIPTDVTGQTTIVWMDAMGNRLGTGPSLSRQVDGTRLFYGITLPPDLAAHYGAPPRTELVVTETTSQTIHTLSQPDSVTLSGKVTTPDGHPISMATVTASLMMNGTVGKLFTATTDPLGRYQLTTLTGDLTLSASARGYVAARKSVEYARLSTPSIQPAPDRSSNNFNLVLSPLAGPTIHYDFTYTTTASAEATITLPYYSDYADVSISAYNETTGEPLDSLMVQYPEVQLLSGAKAGDRIRLTASSLKDSFMPVETTVTLNTDEDWVDSVLFALKELGGIEVSFLQTDNQAVTAALYDSDGLLCRQESFIEPTLSFAGLKDGDYTVVTMGSDPLLSQLLNLSDYSSVGLTEGTDYVRSKVKVESGIIATVMNNKIPTLDASPYYYIDETRTTFMPNKTEVSTSSNVTLRAAIAFKESIKDRVSNVRLLVDYPSLAASFVEGSSMTGTKMVRATVENGRVIIPIDQAYLDEPARFILTAIDQGTLVASAQVQFDLDGRELTQPIGVATCDVKYMTIVAPKSIYKLSFPVSGHAPALSPIRVYAGNDLLIGETQSLADGSWSLHVELPDCPNLSTVPVYAVITTKQGREARTETVNVMYNKDKIHPLHVLMYPPLVSNFNNPNDYSSVISDAERLCIDFDYENPMSLNDQWYSAYVHTSNPFLFEIILNTTDSSLVKHVILEYETVNGEVDFLRAEYDGHTGHWMCSVNLQNDAVCNVDVDFLDETERKIDANMQYLVTHLMDFYREYMAAINEEFERVLTAWSTETNADKQRQLFDELSELMGIDLSTIGEEGETDMTLDELVDTIDIELDGIDVDGFLQGFDQYNVDMGDNVSVTHTDGLSPDQLLHEGYTAINMTDGSTIYQLVEEGRYVLVDFQNDYRMEVRGKAADRLAPLRGIVGDPDWWFNALTCIYISIQGVVDFSRHCSLGAWKFCESKIAQYTIRETQFLIKCQKAGKVVEEGSKAAKTLAKLHKSKENMKFVSDAMRQLAYDGYTPLKAKHVIPVPLTSAGQKTLKLLDAFKTVGEVFSWAAVLNDIKQMIEKLRELETMLNSVPNPCLEDQENANRLRKDIFDFFKYQVAFYYGLALADLGSTETIQKGIETIIPSGGLTINAVLGSVFVALAKLGAGMANDETFKNKMYYYEGELCFLSCDEEYRKKQDKWWKARYRAENGKPNKFPYVGVAIDPSGYVYEAVADNRVENAKATIYFKQTGEDEYGDQHDEVVKWNAEAYRQENPLLTDAEGKYAWDVPQGLWQVKVEKEGYETAYSDWLPVPPPQLDINIPLVRNTLPDVKTVRAYEDGVEVTFNEYMRPGSLTADRILLSQNGQSVAYHINQLDRSKAYDSSDTYVSTIKVKTDTPLAYGSKVQLTVRREVEAYNGLQMQHDYQQEFAVVREVYAIGTDSIVEVARGEERIITVHAFPASASQGMKLIAKSLLGTIATVTGEATFDANGEAHLVVRGKVGGETALLLGLENSKVTSHSVIMVEDPSMLPVYAPTASHFSGTYIEAGEKVALSCETKGATIWYTTDGTCPCDENGTRVKYTVPITVTQPITIRAYAVKGDKVSRVVSFNYNIYDPVGIDEISPSDDEVEESWYSVSGVKLGAKPNQKGVYILNGNKVVVK